MRRWATFLLLLRSAAAAPISPVYDTPLPRTLSVCVQNYPPFVCGADSQSKTLAELSHAALAPVYKGSNASLLDGFDVGLVKQVLGSLSIAPVFRAYPDTSSMFVALRNGECDFAASAVELDPARAVCDRSCPDTTHTPLRSNFSSADYELPEYHGRLATMCCLEYGQSYLLSGLSLLSLSVGQPTSVLEAILSVELVNAASPVFIAMFGFATLMHLAERRRNAVSFGSHTNAVYFAFVATSTMGFGDVVPVTLFGRLLTIFWCVFTLVSISAFGGIVSSHLTVGYYAVTPLDSLRDLRLSQLCVERNYEVVHALLADSYNTPLDPATQLLPTGLAGGPRLAAHAGECVDAVLSGASLAFLSDLPLLQWVANVRYAPQPLHVGPSLRDNPLVWAFPSGSAARAQLDVALARSLVSGADARRRAALGDVWFGRARGGAAPPMGSTLDVPQLTIAALLGGTWLCLVCAPLLRRARAVALRFARLRLGLDVRAGLARLGLAPPKEDDDAELADDDLAHLLGVAPAAAPKGVAGVELETMRAGN